MGIKKFLSFILGKKNLTFWLIFLNCLSLTPIRVEVPHNLIKIESNAQWYGQNQSLKVIKESISFYFFDKQFPIEDFEKQYYNEKDCKKKNDLLLSYFVQSKNQNLTSEEVLEFQNYALDLIQSCKENEYIEKNAKNMIYWFSTYEEYR
jgi:FKBP-type peptidyl-prolyl cis-trans isomerase (trigger factor)